MYSKSIDVYSITFKDFAVDLVIFRYRHEVRERSSINHHLIMVKEFMCPSDPRSYFSIGSLKSVQIVDQFQVSDWSSYVANLTLAMNSLY